MEDRVYAAVVADTMGQGIRARVAEHHEAHPLEPGAPVELLRPENRDALRLFEHVLDGLVAAGVLRREGGRVAASSHVPTLTADQEARAGRLAARLLEAGLGAPQVSDLDPSAPLHETQALLEYLVREGKAVRLSAALVLDREAMDSFVSRVKSELAGQSGLGPADFRPLADVSRRVLVPLLQHLDVLGVTARVGDLRDVVG